MRRENRLIDKLRSVKSPGDFLIKFTNKMICYKSRFRFYENGYKRNQQIAFNSTMNFLAGYYAKKYNKITKEYKEEIDKNDQNLPHDREKIVWVCWFQGFDNAPEIVKACRKSLDKYIREDFTIVEITEDNFENYCKLPDHVMEKYKKGYISKTHLSDLIRLELLISHGGIWLDSTILCTGKLPDYMYDSEFFMPQSIFLETLSFPYRIDNFFITACQNHKILLLTQKLIYYYLTQNDSFEIYLLTYMFFELAIDQYKDEWRKVIPFSRSNMHLLHERMCADFNKTAYEEITRVSPVHKLTYKDEDFQVFLTEVCSGESYYEHIVNNQQ